MKTILIADDHEIVRNGIKLILDSLSPELNIIEAETCAGVLALLNKGYIDFVVLDMYLADGNILSMIQHIVERHPKTGIMIYSMSSEKIYAKRFLRLGVKGFVSKQASLNTLEEAIRKFFKGDIYISPELQRHLFAAYEPGEPENPIDTLSDRELEVAEYIVTGMGSKEIAQKMSLDITTISTYRRRAFEKLKVENMIELKDKFLLYKM